jgi:hypothetical protein
MAQIAHDPPRRPSLIRATAALAAAAAIAAGAFALPHHGGGAAPAAPSAVHAIVPPAGWKATPAALRHLVTAELGATTSVPRYPASSALARVRTTTCSAGICAVAYNVDYTPAFHTIAAMTAQQGAILDAAFRDRSLRGISLTAWGPSSANGKVAQNPIFQLDCSRSDVRGLDLAHAAAPMLLGRCAYVPYVHS